MTAVPARSASEDSTAGLAQAADRFLPGATTAPVTGSRHLLRVEFEAGMAVVRQWPAETTREHVEFVHAVHAAAETADLAFIAAMLALPGEQATVLALNGRLYDARVWLPGEPLGQTEMTERAGDAVALPAVVPQAALVATIEAVARFHETAAALTRQDQRLTIRQLRQATRQLWQVHRERLRPVAPSFPAVQHWIRVGERALPLALALIDQESAVTEATSVVGHHRLWPAHVLRRHHDGDATISGLIGLSDPAWGSPLLDLAQIATRFARWSPDLIETVIGAYSTVRPLAPAERRLLPAVATLDLIVQAGRLLDLAYGPPVKAAPPVASSPLVVAAEAMVSTLEAVTQSLVDLTPHERGAGPRRRRGPARGGPAKRRPGPSRQRRDHLT